MLNEVLQTIKMLKRVENPTQEVKETLDFLEQSLKTKTKQNILDLMIIGDAYGYGELQSGLKEMINLLEQMKNQNK